MKSLAIHLTEILYTDPNILLLYSSNLIFNNYNRISGYYVGKS